MTTGSSFSAGVFSRWASTDWRAAISARWFELGVMVRVQILSSFLSGQMEISYSIRD